MGVVDTALRLEGKVKYIFGANDVAGGKGDCSSYTQYVYKQHGVDIGRDTRAQLSKVTKVSKENLQPGDLVFFQGTYRKGVSHVGIYIGNGKFIHNSSSAGKTVVSDLNSSYYKNHWLTGGRVKGVNGGTGVESGTGNIIQTGFTDSLETGAKTLASGAVKALVILVLLIMAFVLFTQGFGYKLGG